MVRYRRNFVAGGTYFFTLTLTDRRSSALVDHIGTLRAAFRRARHERPFVIDAIVVLPDHLHAVLTLPPDDVDYPGRWRLIKTLFSNRVLAVRGPQTRHRSGELALWQRRFWEHTIRDEDDLARHVDYIHFNPVKHRLVSCVRDWPHSLFHRHVRQRLLPPDWAGDVREAPGGYGRAAEPAVTRLSEATCGGQSRGRRVSPGYRSAHPGYACYLTIGQEM
jgi:putative transposase